MTNVEALQALYAALGGEPADVANASTIVEVLNAIAAKYEGQDDATLNPEAIANIAAVADKISGGGEANFTKIHTATYGTSYIEGEVSYRFNPLYIYNNDSDEILLSEDNSSGGVFIILNPVKKITLGDIGSSPHIIFTPAENYEGIYGSISEFNFTGDQVVANDGKTYSAYVNFNFSSYTMERFDDAFPSQIE